MEREKLIATVIAAQNGDTEALNTLFNEYYNSVYYYMLKLAEDEQVACEATQNAFIVAIRRISTLKEPAAFVGWLKGIATNQLKDFRTKEKKSEHLVYEGDDGYSVLDTLEEARTEFIPDEALDQKDLQNTILGILSELSVEQRSATMLYYYDELSIKQIAQIQGVSEGTVKSRLNYARKSIKASVEEYEKKNNIKLHCVGVLPLLLWLFATTKKETMPAGAAKTMASGISKVTGTPITLSNTGSGIGKKLAAGSAAAVKAATSSTNAVSQGTAIPLSQKVLSGVAAAAVALSGFSAAQNISLRNTVDQLNQKVSHLEATISEIKDQLFVPSAPTVPIQTNPSESTTSSQEATQPSANITVLYVPDGCSYTTKDGIILSAGVAMPATPSVGDMFSTTDYTYKYGYRYYEMHINSTHIQQWTQSGNAGWGVVVKDKTKTDYEALLPQINGAPLTNLNYAFYNCQNMVVAPAIPDGVVDMGSAFIGCIALTEAPAIPTSVTSLHMTFSGCVALVNVPHIPVGVKYMNLTFDSCTSLETPPNIPDGVIEINSIFQNCHLLKAAPVIPDTVKEMSQAFYECHSLVEPPVIPYGVFDISFAFYNCRSLIRKPDIPDSVTKSDLAFAYCSSLPK